MVSNNQFMEGDVQPERVFELPAEFMGQMEQKGVRAEFLDEGAPYIDHIPVVIDPTPIYESRPEMVQTRTGPVLVRRKVTKTKLYRPDGRVAVVAATNRQRLLNKRDANGKPLFMTTPPMELPENEEICEFCFKPFRPDTFKERMDNAGNKAALTDEQRRLLAKSGISLEEGVNNARYKKAQHIAIKHGKLAAFTRNPAYLEYMESKEQLGEEPVKRGRGRPRKVS